MHILYFLFPKVTFNSFSTPIFFTLISFYSLVTFFPLLSLFIRTSIPSNLINMIIQNSIKGVFVHLDVKMRFFLDFYFLNSLICYSNYIVPFLLAHTLNLITPSVLTTVECDF
ncbi:112aa long hypothetical protein [Pyrococcus horikoshii OT3]|uniref:Uncharacterized protein n=1 Tax=Pyrococcus horikoshii (strain ATCC 700860 / DSM 12428 / JCM 9974 / NBRC 100139 / OT-3) TaxID=70601 RepID=O59559_PYRHO|nr:112aa long hypothetical protein [Pyrococcus horikoshii OT3]